MKDYIYIIINDLGYAKIGISKNPKRRLKQLQTGNAHKLTLWFTEEFECTRNHLLHIEADIHKKIAFYNTKCVGEWFQLEAEQLNSIRNLIIFYRIRYENDLNSFNPLFR